MVGIAGRSRGCVTCRKRKVKCDETHPVCRRCLKAGRECGGYVTNNFIDGLPLSLRRNVNKGPSTSQAAQPRPTAGFVTQAESWDDNAETDKVEQDQYLLQLQKHPDLEARGEHVLDWLSLWSRVDPTYTLNLSPFRDLLYMTYTATCLFRAPHTSEDLQWMATPSKGDPGRGLTGSSFLSLSTTFFGEEHHQGKVVSVGRERYGNALQDLNHALADPNINWTVDVLKSVMVLTLYEFLQPTQSSGWINHSQGLERLFALRGPLAHIEPESRAIYESFRPTLILASLATRRESLFVSEEWKTLPWSLDPSEKKPAQYLFDILADATILVRDEDDLQMSVGNGIDVSTSELFISTAGLADELIRQIEEWYQGWKSLYGHEKQETLYSRLPQSFVSSIASEEDFPWTSVYTYPSLERANEEAICNATLILLLHCRRSMMLWDPNHSPEAISDLSARAYQAGIEICRSVDYHLLDFQVGVGGLNMMFPMRLAWQAVGENSTALGRWLISISEAISQGRLGRWGSAAKIMSMRPRRQ